MGIEITDKKLTFVIYGDPVCEAIIVGDVEGLLEYIESIALELADGESTMRTITRTIKRQDMTEDELRASPEI